LIDNIKEHAYEREGPKWFAIYVRTRYYTGINRNNCKIENSCAICDALAVLADRAQNIIGYEYNVKLTAIQNHWKKSGIENILFQIRVKVK